MSWMLSGIPTLVASVIAAVAAVSGILLNRRSTRDIEVSKWRRDIERELAGHALGYIAQAQQLFEEAAIDLRWSRSYAAPESPASLDRLRVSAEKREKGIEFGQKVEVSIAELELIASPDVLAVTSSISRDIGGMVHHLRPGGGADDFFEAYTEHAQNLRESRQQLIAAIRQDLGIEDCR
jgi:hypothetical protein